MSEPRFSIFLAPRQCGKSWFQKLWEESLKQKSDPPIETPLDTLRREG